MKKTILAIMGILFLSTGAAKADDDRPITVSQLPQPAQQFIKKYYNEEKIAYAKRESDFFEVKYEVVFTNSVKVEFQRNGEWKKVDCKYVSVPDELIPTRIKDYIKVHYPEYTIVKIDRDKHDYELDLAIDKRKELELKFDKQFNLIDIDID